MILAQGDSLSPLEFAMKGVASPFGTAQKTLLHLIRGNISLGEVLTQIDESLEGCDEGHTQLMRKLPKDEEAHSLAVQWALIAPNLNRIISELKVKAALPREEQTFEDFGLAAVIDDMLTTRTMTFIKNSLYSAS